MKCYQRAITGTSIKRLCEIAYTEFRDGPYDSQEELCIPQMRLSVDRYRLDEKKYRASGHRRLLDLLPNQKQMYLGGLCVRPAGFATDHEWIKNAMIYRGRKYIKNYGPSDNPVC